FSTRQATTKDLPLLPSIFNHYIIHSVISFRLEPINVDFFETVYASTTARGLPFVVVTTPTTGGEQNVIGYAYASPYRPGYDAYRHTVEISVYVDHRYHSVSAGTALMDALMGALRTARVPEPTRFPSKLEEAPRDVADDSVVNSERTGRVRQVLAIMSLDAEGRDGGHGLEKFYARWGFEKVGSLRSVGFKFGRWIDVSMLQVSL
ncbi:hypothetical protein P691DRAFT_624546, partial [Macrolepiota fuliginosa MF-IS2]